MNPNGYGKPGEVLGAHPKAALPRRLGWKAAQVWPTLVWHPWAYAPASIVNRIAPPGTPMTGYLLGLWTLAGVLALKLVVFLSILVETCYNCGISLSLFSNL